MDSASADNRVLVLLPTADVERLSVRTLVDVGIDWTSFDDLDALLRELEWGAAALVVTEQVIDLAAFPLLGERLRYQPAWSDLPIVLLSQSGAESAATGRAVALLGNVAVIERPIREALVLSALRTAVRARARQYALRDQMEALRRSEERFELAAHATQDAIWDIECELEPNGALVLERSVFGAGVDESTDLNGWLARIDPLDRKRVLASLHAALEGSDARWTQEYRYRDASGELRDMLDRGQIIRNAHGVAVRAVGAMMDITTRKRSERNNALLASIVASSDDAIVSKDLDGTIRSWNAGAERVFGYSASEAVGRPIALIIPPDKLAEEARILERLSRGERIDHFETKRVAKDGRVLDISLTVSPLVDRSGQVYGASKVARDVTARKRAEAELRRQDAKLRLLWEAAAVLLTTDRPDTMLGGVFDKIAAYFELDAYLNFVVDEGGAALKLESSGGIDETDAAALHRVAFGTSLWGQVAVERRPIARAAILESADDLAAVARRLGFRAFTSYPLLVEDRLLGVLSFASRRRDEFERDEIAFLGAICYYVTAGYERLQLIGRLRESDYRKDEFLATLAHELRNPLAPIRNALEILRVNARDPSPVEHAARAMIERQLEQMVRLVDDLLDVSRITRGQLDLRKERVPLARVIENAIDTSRPLIDSGRHRLDVALPSQPVFLDADPLRLAQVFANLLNNAARYMDQGGRIWLDAEREGDWVIIRVRDEGVGIPATELGRIFDMFARVNDTEQRSPAGLGIGLTLVRRIVELHGGTVEARSKGVGRGTELIVRLPVAQPAGAETAAPVSPRSKVQPVTYRVLVADDNRDAAESLGMLLRLMGNDVRTVYDGIEAVEEAEEFRPDVVLLDIGMPRLNGYEAARRIRELRYCEDSMLVALTGWGQEEDKRRASAAGFDRHFTKPVDPADLQQLIADLSAD